jgi:hypothetical protein
MQVDLNFFEIRLWHCLVNILWTQLTLLCEQVFEKYHNWRLHLLKNVLIYDFLHIFILHRAQTQTSTARKQFQALNLGQQRFYLLHNLLCLLPEEILTRMEISEGFVVILFCVSTFLSLQNYSQVFSLFELFLQQWNLNFLQI